MSSCVSPAASRWRASRRWWAVRLGGLPKRTPLAFARVYTTKPSFRAPSGYATATLAPSKGRLMRCTVDGLTPSRSAMTRMPGRPGVARASRIRFSSAGAIGGRPRRLKQQMPSLCLPIIRRENVEHANAPHPFALLRAHCERPSPAAAPPSSVMNSVASFDHLVGAGKQRRWHFETKRLSRF